MTSTTAAAGADLSRTRRRNRRRALAIAVSPGVAGLVVIGGIVAGFAGIAVGALAGVAVLAAVVITTWSSATTGLLRVLHARRADEEMLPGIFTLSDGLCASMGLTHPDVYVVDDNVPNALCLGRSSRTATLVVTSGLADMLEPVALEAVLAHELMHIKRGDIVPATMAAAVLLPLGAVVPRAGALVHALAGRGREQVADGLAVQVTRYPPGLCEALSKMTEGGSGTAGSRLRATRVAEVTRWLWTVELADPAGRRAEGGELIGQLDAPSVRIAALQEL